MALPLNQTIQRGLAGVDGEDIDMWEATPRDLRGGI